MLVFKLIFLHETEVQKADSTYRLKYGTMIKERVGFVCQYNDKLTCL